MSENSTETPSSENDTGSQKDLRQAGVPTDFTVNVGEQSFEVHRDLIMSKSDYFRAMLSHDTKENQQGFVDMKDVNSSVVGQCIEFMYTEEMNDVSINIENIEDVLQATELMQLHKLKNTCVEFLEKSLNDLTCLRISLILSKFSITEMEEKILSTLQKTYYIEDVSDLLEMSKTDFAEYIGKNGFAPNMISWNCLVHWINHDVEHRSEFIYELSNQLSWKEFPSDFFLEAVWNDPLFKDDKQCTDLLFENVFTDIEIFKVNLSVDNFYILEKMANEFRFVPKQIKQMIPKFKTSHFAGLSRQNDFKLQTKEELISIFVDEEQEYLTNEKWKWFASITWIKHDSAVRKSFLADFMQTIKFENLPSTFIENVIVNNKLVKENPKCLNLILDEVFKKKPDFSMYYIAFLYSDGHIALLDLASKTANNITILLKLECSQIINFNGKLCLLTGNKLYYMNKSKQFIQKKSMICHELDAETKIAATEDYIFVIHRDWMALYDAVTNQWKENLPGVREYFSVNDFAVVSKNDTILVFGSSENNDIMCLSFIYDKGIWLEISPGISKYSLPIANNTSAVTINEDIIFVHYSSEATKFNLKTRTSIGLSDLLVNRKIAVRCSIQCDKCFRRVSYNEYESKKEISPSVKWPLLIAGKLFVVKNPNTVLTYWENPNSSCDCKWQTFTNLPELVSRDTYSSTPIPITNVCEVPKYFV